MALDRQHLSVALHIMRQTAYMPYFIVTKRFENAIISHTSAYNRQALQNSFYRATSGFESLHLQQHRAVGIE